MKVPPIFLCEFWDLNRWKGQVETTHLSICRSIVPGRRFSDAARNLTFNKVKNTFIHDRLRLSSGFLMIKDLKNVFASLTVAFASFYPNKFEDPSIKKIPDESVIPSGGREVKMPNFELLLTCVNETEMKIILNSRSKWKNSVVSRNLGWFQPYSLVPLQAWTLQRQQ